MAVFGSIPAFIGLDGGLLDAIVFDSRLPLGTTVKVHAWGRLE